MAPNVSKLMRQVDENDRPRELSGWRDGKPVEDPDKLKRWGLVTAKPSEFLVHVRGGKVLQESSGQGSTCFKWPWDAVSIVPTSLQRLSFKADQVTAEKVGVEVTGLAVYRITEPLLAYRVLNFSFPERAQQKLEQTLTSMFVGASRRIIAGLTVEECLQKRKTALAQELLREIGPVVGGKGRPDDRTMQGWGVVLDTIEIQEVRVLSETVFAAMQAPYRAELDRAAREAQGAAARDVAARDAENRRTVEEAKLLAEQQIAERRAESARAQAEGEARDAIRRSELERAREAAQLSERQAIEEAKLASERAIAEAALREQAATEHARLSSDATLAEAREAEARRRAERGAQDRLAALSREVELAQADVAAHEARAEAARRQGELRRAEALLVAELGRAVSEQAAHAGRLEAEVEGLRAHAAVTRAEAQSKVLHAQKLPELAAAMGSRMGEVKINQWGGDGNPFGSIVQAVQAIVDLAKST